MNPENKLALFESKSIRRTWHHQEWWFSVVDVIEALTDSTVPRRYWSDLKIKLQEEGSELYEKIVQLKLESSDSKKYLTGCANTEGLFRLIQSSELEQICNLLHNVHVMLLSQHNPVSQTLWSPLKKRSSLQNRKVAKRGGSVMGVPRKEAEKELGRSVISKENFLEGGDRKKKLQ